MAKSEKIVLTRPKNKSLLFLNQLVNQGVVSNYSHKVIIEPLTEVQILHTELPSVETVDALVMTSTEPLKMDRVKAYKDKPLYVVGSATAAEAKKVGFTKIVSVSPGAEKLIESLHHSSLIEGGRFLYLRGEKVSHDLANVFSSYRWYESIVYASQSAGHLSKSFLEDIRDGAVSDITFFSVGAGEIFHDLSNAYNLSGSLAHVRALCMSDRVLKCVQPLFGERTYRAETPDARGMLNLVQNVLQKGYT